MRPLRPALLLLPLALISLAGCSGTRFGDQLARSFSQPSAGASSASSSGSKTAPQAPSGTGTLKPAAGAGAAGLPTVDPKATGPSTATGRTAALSKPVPSKPVPTVAPPAPAPYRVTIKLPAADPSSPAEAVTDALRAAGVAFEVETIQRVPAGGDAPIAPLRSPAPAPR